jgi:site-specific recombinase
MIYCVKFPVQGGFDIEEIRRRIRLLDLLDKSQDNDSEENKVIRLEDQDLINLRKCVKVTRFNNIHKDIVTFIDKVMKD